ncbi:MAG: PKD domain-containing protein [bacterium]
MRAIILICILFLFVGPSLVLATEITSTPAGGVWNDTATWNEGIVPGAGDDVTISSTVSVNVNADCHDLTVTKTGILQTGLTGHWTLTVGGFATNEGSIQNNVYNLSIVLSGDLTDNGSWTNLRTTLDAPVDQHLSMDSTATFTSEFILDGSAVGNLIADSSLRFAGKIDLNDGTMILEPGSSLTATGTYLQNARILGNGNDLTLRDNCYLSNTLVDAVDLHGMMNLASGVTFSGAMTVSDTLQVHPTGHVTLEVQDGLDNQGLIRNNIYNLSINMEGDLNSGGDWINYRTTMLGSGDQNLSMGAASVFTSELILQTGAVGNLIATTPLRLDDTVNLNGGTMVLQPGNSLVVSGGTILDATLICNGNYLTLSDGTYLSNSVVDAAVLLGVVETYTGVSFTSGLTVVGTLQNRAAGTVTIDVSGGLTNQGVIQKNIYPFYLNLSGDMVNNGDWTNTRTTLMGLTDQHLRMNGTATFTSELVLDNDATGSLIADTPLRLGNLLDLNGGAMTLTAGNSGLSVEASVLVGDGSISANGNDVTLRGGAYLTSTTVDSANFHGDVQVVSSVGFTGGATVNDTLRNRAIGTVTLDIQGDLTNHGLIKNNVYAFYITLDGDLNNNGNWQCTRTTMSGSSDQYLSMDDLANFTSELLLDAGAVGGLFATTPLNLSNLMDLNGGSLTLSPGSALSVEGGRVVGGNFYCNGNDLTLGEGAYLQDATIDAAALYGLVEVFTGVTFSGGVTVVDTLQNRFSGHMTLSVDGALLNRGLVRNNTPYSLYILTTGSVVNEGVWENTKVTMDGPVDQYIGATDANPLEVPQFILDSNLTGGGYQWYKDGGVIGGETGATLSFAHIGTAEHGSYHCEDITKSLSRDFLIVSGSLSAEFTADVTAGHLPLTVNFTYTGGSATGWDWDFDGDGVFDSDLENPSWEYTELGFYTVTLIASNEFGEVKEVKADYIEVQDLSGVPATPTVIALEQNYPNPFNPLTKIRFSLPTASHVRLTTYDVAGRRVGVLTNKQWPAGNHTVVWEPRDQSSGVFFYKLESGGREIIRKCVLVK